MHNYPPWVLTLSDEELIRAFGRETIARGTEYAAQGRVGTFQIPNQTMVMAQVRGQHYRSYHTTVLYDGRGVRGSCSCPMRANCKHVVALIAHMRNVSRRRATSAWQLALGPVLDRPEPGRSGVPLALMVTDRADGISFRPMKAGARDKWVKSGASWNDLRWAWQSASLDQAHANALRALLASQPETLAYGNTGESLILDGLRPEVWPALRHVRDVGVPFLQGPDTGAIVLHEDAAGPVMHLVRTPEGVSLGPAIELDGTLHPADSVRLVGRPTHGVVLRRAGEVVLAPLSRSLTDAEHRLFLASRPVIVPDAELPLFAAGFLPQLKRQFAVEIAEDVELPEVQPVRLTCRVDFTDTLASIDWRFTYGAVELHPAPRADDPPVRDQQAEAALTASVPEGPWKMPGYGGVTRLNPATLNGRPLFDFVAETLPALRALEGIDVRLNREPPEFREAPEAPTVTLSVTDADAGDWFNLGVTVMLGEEKVPLTELISALTRGDDHLLLDSGTWFSLESPELGQLRDLIAEAGLLTDSDGEGLRLRAEHAGLWEELVQLGVVAEQSAAWREATSALLDLDSLPVAAPPEGLRADLRPYQETGYRWMAFLRRARLGGILADEMGLGKTVQTLALLQACAEAGELDVPALVVAPTSVVGTWVAEAQRFAPELRVLAVTETEKRRGVPLADAVGPADLVVTSYTLLRLEADDYRALPWSTVVLDEAQFVKNHASQAYKAVRRLNARTKLALTGTPLENNLMDLWSLLSIVAPGLFPDPRDFTDLYRKPIEGGDAEVLARLHRRIRPLLLRRTKAAVATELPAKQEQVLPVELSASHRRTYDRHLTRERQKVLGLVGDMNRNRITILRSLTLLRQLALSPSLIDAGYQAQSAKVDVLVEMLHELIAEGHRALVFSQFTSYLALVRERLATERIDYEYLDGRTRDRAARVEAFRTGTAPVFLISLKAGGFGLTLTEADYVFILDPWWNPAAELQAIDRTHRIGQDKPVNVYRLVSADTIEEKVVALQQRKRDLFDSVVGSDADLAAPLSAADIRGLLEP